MIYLSWRETPRGPLQRRTAVTARHEEFPAASNALKIRVLLPTSKGMPAAVQAAVPLAVPEAPPDVDHFTDTTPTLSAAVPMHVMAAADVETMVNAGDVIFSEGGTVSAGKSAGFLEVLVDIG